MKLLSIIIPVFNAEKYLQNCISSILNQNFSDFEVLLIDDGSKDGSGEICDYFASKDSRIRVFHEENGGPSRARNIGLREACGKYVEFIDSDDELYPDSLEKMALCASDGNPDMIIATSKVINEAEVEVESLAMTEQGEIIIKEVLNTMDTRNKAVFLHYLWNKWYRRERIIQGNLQFDEAEQLGEDFIFNCQFLRECNRIHASDVLLYKYYKRNNASLSGKYHPDELRRRRKMDETLLNLFRYADEDFNPEKVYEMIGSITLASIQSVFASGSPQSWIEKYRYIKRFLDSEYMNNIRAYKNSDRRKSKSEAAALMLLSHRCIWGYLMVFGLKQVR